MLAGDKEYLIDALALHDHMHLLQDIMENANILKVTRLAEPHIACGRDYSDLLGYCDGLQVML